MLGLELSAGRDKIEPETCPAIPNTAANGAWTRTDFKSCRRRPLDQHCPRASGIVSDPSDPGGKRCKTARPERPIAPRDAIRLDVTRDAWISEVGREADGNNGGAPRLKLKSIQEMSLLDIDPKPLLGRTIRSAVLHVKKAGDEPLETGDGQHCRGRMVRGNRERLRDPARRRDVPPSAAPRPSLVDRRRRYLPRHPGKRRHDLADG